MKTPKDALNLLAAESGKLRLSRHRHAQVLEALNLLEKALGEKLEKPVNTNVEN